MTKKWLGRLVSLLLCSAILIGISTVPPEADAAETSDTATVYYYTPYKNWSTVNIHHNSSGSWTAVPGTPMEAACANWTSKTIPVSSTALFKVVFNNGSSAWDNNGGQDYSVGPGIYQVKNGQVQADASDPCQPQEVGNTATVYYKANASWSNVNIHYAPNGAAWTTAPGIAMDQACTGWTKKTIELGTAAGLAATFNNGSAWDNNGGKNYSLGTGDIKVESGTVSSGNPCGGDISDVTPPSVPSGLTAGAVTSSSASFSWSASTDDTAVTGYDIYRNGSLIKADAAATNYSDSGLSADTAYSYTVLAKDAAGNKSAQSPALVITTAPISSVNKAEVYYYTKTRAWSTVNIHYRPTGSTWTTVPGIAMNEAACTDWAKKTVDLGSASEMTAAFNNGSAWDNNSGADYKLSSGIVTVKDGVVAVNAISPCAPLPEDITPPSVPTGLQAAANKLKITLTWNHSIDNEGGRGIGGYLITRTGGSFGPKTFTTASNSYLDSGLEPTTIYSYTVQAYDKAEPRNMSESSIPASSTTGEEDPMPAGGTPLGTDIREDSIYFVMTARFYDGDSTNNVGGVNHVKSGNAANDDPMFRGDFKGLIEKLDYIKALGFSAIWITPVVLNRSDYDFHGYHGYDFFRVDPRLESEGASYQDLINEAHSKGIKIIQDVVYNHSSRWGAKDLFTPKVFGVRDSQWSWYYDEPIPGYEYDGLRANADGKMYNGDLWSTEEPAGNTCRNWGVQSGYNNEGKKIYNCQWPNPTSGMFPSEYYHQCWIGNWEGEDSRSCWIHEDLADFNTESKVVQDYLKEAYRRFIDMGVDSFRIDTAVHIPRVIWNRHFLPDAQNYAVEKFGEKGKNFFMFGEVGSFVNDKWNRGSVNHSAQFFTWKERMTYSADDKTAVMEQFNYENNMGTGNQPISNNAFLNGNSYHKPDHSQFSGMSVIDMRMHMNFGDAYNAFYNGKDSDDSYNDATYNVVYVDSHDYGPNKSETRFAGGTAAWAENMSLMWTFRGIPTLYYGSEIEFQAGAKIDCGPTCPLATTGRAYYGDNLEGTVVASDFGKVASASGAVAATLEKPLVKHVQRLNQIRRQIPALQKGQYSTEGISGGMAYKRRYTDTDKGIDSFALVTISQSATFNGIPNGTYKDAITGDVQHVTNGTLTASVSGQGNARIYVLDLPNNAAPGKIGESGPYLK